jgi:hypothetical protein
VSVCNFFKQGMILLMIMLASKILQKSDNLLTAAVLTSDSESWRKLQKKGSKCSLAWSRPIP